MFGRRRLLFDVGSKNCIEHLKVRDLDVYCLDK